MATIRQRGPDQWHIQIRRRGWPVVTETKRTRKDAEAYARDVEGQMDRGIFVDRTPAERTTFREVLRRYLTEVTEKRPGAISRAAERARLERIMRDEPALCSYAVAHLRPEHFEEYRDRRLTQTVKRGKSDGRGQYKPEVIPPGRMRKDGKPRVNAALPKRPPTPPKLISKGTVKRELTLLKKAIDHSKRRLGVLINPVNSEDVKRPVVNDERNVRLAPEEIERLLKECYAARNIWVGPMADFGFEVGARRGSLLRLEWRDVDLPGRSVLLRGVKNSRNPEEVIDQRVGLTPAAIAILKKLPRSVCGRVFPISASAFRAAFNRARARAGLEHFRFHDTRHERVSSLVEAGWSDTQVMAQSGHRDPKSLKRYANLRQAFLADALAALPSTKGREKWA